MLTNSTSISAQRDPPVIVALILVCAVVSGFLALSPPTASFPEGVKTLEYVVNANPLKMWILIITTLVNIFIVASWLARKLGFKKQGSRLSSLTQNKGRES